MRATPSGRAASLASSVGYLTTFAFYFSGHKLLPTPTCPPKRIDVPNVPPTPASSPVTLPQERDAVNLCVSSGQAPPACRPAPALPGHVTEAM